MLEAMGTSKKSEEEKRRCLDKRTPAQAAFEKMQEKRVRQGQSGPTPTALVAQALFLTFVALPKLVFLCTGMTDGCHQLLIMAKFLSSHKVCFHDNSLS